MNFHCTKYTCSCIQVILNLKCTNKTGSYMQTTTIVSPHIKVAKRDWAFQACLECSEVKSKHNNIISINYLK